MRVWNICLAGIFLIFATQTVLAQTEVTLTATDDTYINGRSAAKNYGNSADIVVHNYGPKVGLAAFDTTSIAGATVTSATLKFRLNKIANDGLIDLQLITSPWSQSTATYSNQPAYSNTVLTFPVLTSSVGDVVSVDITNLVQDWASGAQPAHGIRLSSNQAVKAEFDSLESSGAAMEIIVTTYDGPPNAAPELLPIGDQQVPLGETLEFTISASDADGTVPALTAENLPGNATTASFVDGTFSWTPEVGDIGTYTDVTFIAVDADNGAITDSETVTITVHPAGGEVVTLAATGDTYINARQPDNNFGTSGDVVTHVFGPKTGLVRFDAAVLEGTNIAAATLSFRLNRLAANGTIDVQSIREPWSESTVTHATRPAYSDTLLAMPVSTSDVGQIVTVDITPIVQSWASGAEPAEGLQFSTDENIKAEFDSLDSSGSPMELTVTVDSGEPNTPPQLAEVVDQTVTVGETLEFAISATDEDGTTPVLTASNLPGIDTAADFTEGTFSWTPAAGDVGTYNNVTFTATDADNPAITDREIITITVNPAAGSAVTIDAFQDSYVNGRRTAHNYGGSGDIVVHSHGPKIGFVQFDTATLTGSAISSAILQFRLNNLGADGTVDMQLVDEPWSQSTLTFATQPAHGDTVQSIALSTTDISTVVGIDITSIVQAWADGTQANHGLRLSTDQSIKAEFDSAESAGSAMQLVVTTAASTPDNQPPTLSPIGATTAMVGETLDFTVSASDPDATNTLSFEALGLPAFASLTDAGDGTALMSITPATSDTGEMAVTVRVTDDGEPALSAEETFMLTVADGNEAPTDINLSNASVTEGAAADTLVGSLSTTDPNPEDTHSYTLDDDAGGRFMLGTAGNDLRVLDGALLDPDVASSHIVTVTTTEDRTDGLSYTRDLVITVEADGSASIAITSHEDGQSVPSSGFIVSGTVLDPASIESLSATLVDPALGTTIDNQPLEMSGVNGRFSLAVATADISAGETVEVTITGSETGGTVRSVAINLAVEPYNHMVRQVINRITFGATPELLQTVEAMGPAAYIAQQLNPESIDDSTVQSLVAGFNPTSLLELRRYQVTMTTRSKRQLLEVMTQFWENHFNTNLRSHGKIPYEWNEHQSFRANALGNFRQLLELSAKSPAMVVYLSNFRNKAISPNENYSRELMELHTMGVTGGYTQTDIEEASRAFTGWAVNNNVFYFASHNHDNSPKYVLGQTVNAGGVADGEAVLDIVVNHPATGRFICTKLIQRFVADNAPDSLVTPCAATFAATRNAPDQIAQLVELVLTSPEFADPANFRNKIKTPLEFTNSAIRELQPNLPINDVVWAIKYMGMPLFENHLPTGFSETGDDWVSSNLLIERMKFASDLAMQQVWYGYGFDPVGYFVGQGYETTEGILARLFEVTLGTQPSPQEWQTAYNILTDNGTTPFDIDAPDAETKLRTMIRAVLSYPAYNYQ